ncbi:ferritin-like domain-containing protein [Clostridiisalibacter paucivorans]|uniref:ferritin-like domain-containing protein n=1 Tax=Clostridiisalibacter paucivorans TaxID=408753 RepID=UPI00047DBE17|nr:ferritin family protein [Clostridiisalibacter paucivorans]
MSKSFDGKKLIKTIILTEKKISDLYESLSEKTKDKKAANLFKTLAKDEKRHQKIYQSLLNKLPNQGIIELDDNDADYIDLLIETNIFKNEELKKSYSKLDALEIAEKVERDGILFINELKNLYPDLAKDQIKIILTEEKKHLKLVLDKKLYSTSSSLML